MPEKSDFLDLRILEGLSKHGPRNITDVARKLNIPAETVRKRLKRLNSQIFLRFNTNIYHTNLGLKKSVVFAEASPGYEESLFECLKTNDFWIYVNRCYGMFEGCAAIYAIPSDYCTEFEQFLHLLKKLEVAENVSVFWSTCFQSVPFTCNWFDRQSNTWTFPWDQWIDEISGEGTELPYTLVDPENFPIKADEIDLFILKELEKDATISFAELATNLGVSPQLVGYRFRNHILERNLIESFDVAFFPYDRAVSDAFFFVFRFDNKQDLAKFALSLLDKPFAWGLGKILQENSLFASIYLPKSEFRNFINSLSKLVRKGFLQNHIYVIRDLEKTARQTFSYEYFKKGVWIYDHKKHIQNLREIVRQMGPTKKEVMLAESRKRM